MIAALTERTGNAVEQSDILLLDGGMGTMLQQAGLPLGELPESWEEIRLLPRFRKNLIQ